MGAVRVTAVPLWMYEAIRIRAQIDVRANCPLCPRATIPHHPVLCDDHRETHDLVAVRPRDRDYGVPGDPIGWLVVRR